MWIVTAVSRVVLAGIFWVVVRLFHDVEMHGLENAKGKNPSYFAMAHKRDLDPLVEVPSVLARRGWRALTGDVHFSLRGDAFLPGFLGRIVSNPSWLSRCLRPILLNKILLQLGIRPIENLHHRPAEAWLCEWIATQGDMPIGEVLTPAFLQHVTTTGDEPVHKLQAQPLSQLLSWRYNHALQAWLSADIFFEPARRLAKQQVLGKLKQQLAELGQWLTAGGSLWGSAEGILSPDGALSSITAVLHRVLQLSPPATCVIPISISYDFMTARRPRIFVRLAPPIGQAQLLSIQNLDNQLRYAWLQNAYFTCTQLASGFLVQRYSAENPSFTLNDLVDHIHEQAVRLTAANRHVDQRLLSRSAVKKLAEDFLHYALRYGCVHPLGRNMWAPKIGNLTIKVPPGDVGYRQAPLAYAWNELQDMLSVGALDAHSMPVTQ